uniref:Glutamate receptor n=1 Tax=Oryza glumipatula TaxID=40148 RepID=A0A0E0A596_9ORYZ
MAGYVTIILLLLLPAAVSGAASGGGGCIGAMVDDTSRAGKEEKLAMEMAMEDFTVSGVDVGSPAVAVVLCTMASNGDPVRAASAALSLINERGARALVGLHSWQEAAFVAEIGRQAMVPVLSFAAAAAPSTSRRWPFLVRVARGQHAQMRAVAAVVGSWQWRRVAVLYEDADYGGGAGVFPHLADALRAVGSEVDRRVPVPASPSGDALRRSLGDLMGGQCRVFVVHTSAKVAVALFAEASRMGMMATGYVWIVTDAIAGAIDSLDAAAVSTMQGVIGVRNHISMDTNSKNTRDRLIARLRKRFRSQYPGDDDDGGGGGGGGGGDNDKTRGPHYPALLAYDTIVAVASAMRKTNATAPTRATDPNPSSPDSGETIKIAVSSNGTELLREVKSLRFRGVSGEFGFVDGEFSPPVRFQLINVAAPRYHELGFWSPEHGFSKSAGGCSHRGGDGGGECEPSMRFLGPVIWPGKPWDVPRGWAPPANGSPFTVAVPEKAAFPDFVKVTRHHGRGGDDDDEPSFEGFSIDVFKAAVEHLPYNFHYKFVSFNGTYDSLMQHDYMKSYDILIGDTSISSGRYKFVEFSQPYTESGLVMVVPFSADTWDRSWIFLRPFSPAMWLLIAAVGLYNSVAIWLMERRHNGDYRGGVWKQVTIVLWLSLAALLSPGEEERRLRSSLSKASMAVWLLVAVVLATNYTASLSSLMTAQRLGREAAVTAESLKSAAGALVGCTEGSVVGRYLEEVLMFPGHRVRRLAGDEEHHRALVSGEVKAAFLRVSHAKLLLAKYCNELMTTGPVYHVAGLGFVFPKGSPLLADISQAILEVFENGTIQRLETAMLSAYNCTAAAAAAMDGGAGDLYRLGPENCWGLFLMTLFASTASLAAYGVFFHHGTGGGAAVTGGGHRKQGDGRKDSATVDPGGSSHGDEAPSSASVTAGHGGKDTEMVVISME